MRLVVSTCGTSLLVNPERSRWALLSEIANEDRAKVECHPRGHEVEQWLGDARARVLRCKASEAGSLCAELRGIAELGLEASDQHLLLATDTFVGIECAETIASFLRAQGASVQVEVLRDLNTKSLDDFRRGTHAFANVCRDTVGPMREANYHVVFNLLGGFKAMLAYACVFGMVYADEQIYAFEGAGSPLLRIPRVPVKIDWRQAVHENRNLVRQLALGVLEDRSALLSLPDSLYETLDDLVELTPWGQLEWLAYADQAYRDGLWPSPSTKVRFERDFVRQADKLEPPLVRELNRRVDALVQYQSSGGTTNPRSLHVHAWQGKADGDFTHECYAWSNRGAGRIFLRFEGDVVVLSHLSTQHP